MNEDAAKTMREMVDAVYRSESRRVLATLIRLLGDMFWGDRYCKLEDAFGQHWSVATHLRDVSPEEMQQAMQKTVRVGPIGEFGRCHASIGFPQPFHHDPE